MTENISFENFQKLDLRVGKILKVENIGGADKLYKFEVDLGKKIGKTCDLAIITTREIFKEIKKGAVIFGMKEKNIVFCENTEEILTRISIFCTKGDAVLLEGRVPEKLISKLYV